MRLPERWARILAGLFFLTSVALTISLGVVWSYTMRAFDQSTPAQLPPPVPLSPASVSPLLVHYQLDLPGRGEIFPNLASEKAIDYWPVAILTISNTSDRPMVQTISAQVDGWSYPSRQTFVFAPHETRKLRLSPDLMSQSMHNAEIQTALLHVQITDPVGTPVYSQVRTVYLHSAYDMYWGNKFSNAQFIVRWVTPHEQAVLHLVSDAKHYVPRGRMPGYDQGAKSPRTLSQEVRAQASAVFQALRKSRISYVSSIFTFGNFSGWAERVRLPRETLETDTANCIDVSVAFASAMENLGLDPVIVIVPGHAFTGVRLAPESQDILYLDLTVLPDGTFKQATMRADGWLKATPSSQIITVDIAAARALGIYPLTDGTQVAESEHPHTDSPSLQP